MSIATPKVEGILFKAYINGEWTEWKTGGSIIDGKGQDIQAIKIKLSGEFAEQCDVYYRTHNRHFGWLGWTGNGNAAGTKDINSAIEGYQIQLVKKDSTIDGITNDTKEYCRENITTTTIYYKGYENPNIHYKIGNGKWTSVPGIKMEESSQIEGFPYVITIDLGEETELTACFNDGNGNWDSDNKKNYMFGVGEYTYSDGSITKLN